MKRFADVAQWRAEAFEAFGDPSRPICQLFFRWEDNLQAYRGEDLVVGYLGADLVLLLAPDLPIKLQLNDEPLVEDEKLIAFEAEQIAADLWNLHPSLNAGGVIHAFVTLYGVPHQVPWQRRILVVQ